MKKISWKFVWNFSSSVTNFVLKSQIIRLKIFTQCCQIHILKKFDQKILNIPKMEFMQGCQLIKRPVKNRLLAILPHFFIKKKKTQKEVEKFQEYCQNW